MTRPISKNVDYFPHYIRKTPELKLIIHNHKSEGYMAYYKLLELVADAEYHYLSVKTEDEKNMFELGMEKCDMEVVNDVIRILCNSGQINKEIWKNHKVIWMEDFVKKFRGVWYKRGKTLPKIDSNGNLSVPRNLQERKVSKQKKENEKKKNKGDIEITPDISTIYQKFMDKDDVQPNQSIAKLIQCAIDNHGAQQVYDATGRYHMDDKEIKIQWFFMNDYQDYLTGSWESFDPH